MTLLVEDLIVTRGSFSVGPISLAMTRGVTGLAGATGAGKSTLIETITGLLAPSSGRVSIDGHDPWSRPEHSRAMSVLGYVPQSAVLPSAPTVHEMVTWAGWLKGLPLKAARRAAQEAVHAVGLDEQARTRCGRLSGGMRQRACIAQALVHDPQVLVLDEPTVGLDPVQRRSLHELLSAIGHERTVLISTHLTDDLARACDSIAILANGALVFYSPLQELLTNGSNAHDTLDSLLSEHLGEALP